MERGREGEGEGERFENLGINDHFSTKKKKENVD